MQRFDARLVRDACGNADVLMKEAHDGLFVRYADALERERVLREALEKLDSYLDFSEPVASHSAITFGDASGINAAFEQARAALAQ